MAHVNIWSIIVSAVVAFAVGALWYSPALFGKEWMRLKGISEKDIADASQRGMWKRYVTQFVATVVMFCVLGFIISATGAQSAGNGIFLAFIAWVGFSVMPGISDMLWNKAPFKLFLIDQVCALISWIAGGAIIGGWK